MTISFECANCGKRLKADGTKAGRKIKCPKCNQIQMIGLARTEGTSLAPQAARKTVEQPAWDPRAAPIEEPLPHFGTGIERENHQTESGSEDELPCRRCRQPLLQGSKWCPNCGERCRSNAGRLAPGPRNASLEKRLAGAAIDRLTAILCPLPGLTAIVMGSYSRSEEMVFLGVYAVALGCMVFAIIQLLYMATRSQSIGKRIVRTQVLDFETHRPAGFVKVVCLREFVSSVLFVVPFYPLIDALFVFAEDRRCLHDRLAGTYVADYDEARDRK